MEPVFAGIIVGLFILVACGTFIWHLARGQSLLEDWAQGEGLRIISSERRILRRGSYFFTTGKGQEVYYVTVEDADGKQRSGYVRCGGYFAGMLSDKVTVRWDE
jgi:hypothetical protein